MPTAQEIPSGDMATKPSPSSWPKMLIRLTIGRSESIAQKGYSSLLSVLATDGSFRPAYDSTYGVYEASPPEPDAR